MITEDYVSFETAKLLKEKGFDAEKVSEFGGFYIDYYHNGQFVGIATESMMLNKTLSYWEYLRPTLQMAMKWLREEHRLHISAEMGFDVDNHQYYFFAPSVCRFSDKSGEYESPFGEKEFDTYEEACEAAIRYCLENLI